MKVGDEPHRNSDFLSNVIPSSVQEKSYQGLEASTREPPPSPVPYDNLSTHDYVNINTTKVMNDVSSDGAQSDSEISSNIILSSAEETSYTGLEASTREPPPSSVAYDNLTTHDYVNINVATTKL